MTQNVFEGWEDWLKEFRRDKEVELIHSIEQVDKKHIFEW